MHIRAVYTQNIAERLGHLHPDEREQLENTLKNIEEEKRRMACLFAGGKISDTVWDEMWREWQDRRSQA